MRTVDRSVLLGMGLSLWAIAVFAVAVGILGEIFGAAGAQSWQLGAAAALAAGSGIALYRRLAAQIDTPVLVTLSLIFAGILGQDALALASHLSEQPAVFPLAAERLAQASAQSVMVLAVLSDVLRRMWQREGVAQ